VGPEVAALEFAARHIARCRSVVLLGSGYGVPVAAEAALKLKEASYVHAEGFPAGEFRHGSAALLDGQSALVGIVDRASHELVARPLREAAGTGARRYSVGGDVAGIERLGPLVAEPFNTLAWLVAGQLLALYAGRECGVDGDAPRAISKFISERALEGPASPHGQ
jgi:glucosamine--fructose-6-phosphate aminotransferase (isomerizing)